MIRRLCVVGVGLIGGSLARALRQQQACGEIVGCGRREAPLRLAQQLGVIDRYTLDPGMAVAGADMVVLAVPLGAMPAVLAAIRPALGADTVVTDVGSAKRSVQEAVRQVFGVVPANFVPGHPVAGTEHSGVEASFAELFEDRRVILTPARETSASATARVRRMWQTTGAEVVEMDATHHDAVLAETSHLPHMLAFTLVDCLAGGGDAAEAFAFAAGGFRDFTRIASSDPEMWRDICLANGDALLAAMDRFSEDLAKLREAVERRDGPALQAVFSRAKAARDRWLRG